MSQEGIRCQFDEDGSPKKVGLPDSERDQGPFPEPRLEEGNDGGDRDRVRRIITDKWPTWGPKTGNKPN